MVRALVSVLVVGACASSSPAPSPPSHGPAPVAQPPVAQPPGSGSGSGVFEVATAAGCTLLPQPSAPGHTSVEPQDMVCTHGDYVFDCPAAFDAAKLGCSRSTTKAWATLTPWCCPGPY